MKKIFLIAVIFFANHAFCQFVKSKIFIVRGDSMYVPKDSIITLHVLRNIDKKKAEDFAAKAYHTNDDMQKIILFNQAIALYNDDAEWYNSRGVAELDLGFLDKAKEDLDTSISLNPKFEKPYSNMGNVYHARRDYKRAIQYYNKAISINPNYAKAYNNLALTEQDMGDDQSALSALYTAVRLDTAYAKGYYNIGLIYDQLGNKDSALLFYNHALNIAPQYILALNNRGGVFIYEKKYEDAVKDFSSIISLDNKYPDAYLNRGNAYLFQNNFDRSIADYQKGLELADSTLKYIFCYSLGNAYYNMHQLSQAKEYLNEALKLNPDCANAKELMNRISR